jgi:hypothetical protein
MQLIQGRCVEEALELPHLWCVYHVIVFKLGTVDHIEVPRQEPRVVRTWCNSYSSAKNVLFSLS